MRRLATAVVLDVVGSAAVLILLGLSWQRVRIDREPPFADIVADLGGRGVAPAAFALALVTTAGAVAALATRGLARRVVGVVVTLAGSGVVVASLLGLGTPGDARARTLAAQAVADRSSGGTVVPVTDGVVSVAAHAVWPVLAAVAALLTVVAGVVWVLPAPVAAGSGHGAGVAAGGLAPRYEAPVAAQRPRDASLWSALDHGEDPTVDAAVGSTPDPRPTPRPDARLTRTRHGAYTTRTPDRAPTRVEVLDSRA